MWAAVLEWVRRNGVLPILMDQEDRILRVDELTRTVGLCKSSIYSRIRAGQFPRPIRLGGPGTQAVGWRQSEIMTWLAEREAA